MRVVRILAVSLALTVIVGCQSINEKLGNYFELEGENTSEVQSND